MSPPTPCPSSVLSACPAGLRPNPRPEAAAPRRQPKAPSLQKAESLKGPLSSDSASMIESSLHLMVHKMGLRQESSSQEEVELRTAPPAAGLVVLSTDFGAGTLTTAPAPRFLLSLETHGAAHRLPRRRQKSPSPCPGLCDETWMSLRLRGGVRPPPLESIKCTGIVTMRLEAEL